MPKQKWVFHTQDVYLVSIFVAWTTEAAPCQETVVVMVISHPTPHLATSWLMLPDSRRTG